MDVINQHSVNTMDGIHFFFWILDFYFDDGGMRGNHLEFLELKFTTIQHAVETPSVTQHFAL